MAAFPDIFPTPPLGQPPDEPPLGSSQFTPAPVPGGPRPVPESLAGPLYAPNVGTAPSIPPPPPGFDFDKPPAQSAIPPPPTGFDFSAPPVQPVIPATGATGPLGTAAKQAVSSALTSEDLQKAKPGTMYIQPPDFSVIPETGTTGPMGAAARPKGPVFVHPVQTPKALTTEPTNLELPGLVGQEVSGAIQREAPFLVGPFSTLATGPGHLAQGTAELALAGKEYARNVASGMSPANAFAFLAPDIRKQAASGVTHSVQGAFETAGPALGGEMGVAAVGRTLAQNAVVGGAIAGGIIADMGTAKGLKHLGVAPEYADFAGTMAGLAVGFGIPPVAGWWTRPEVPPEVKALAQAVSDGKPTGDRFQDASRIDKMTRYATQTEDPATAAVARATLLRQYGIRIPEPAGVAPEPVPSAAEEQGLRPEPTAPPPPQYNSAEFTKAHNLWNTATNKAAGEYMNANPGVSFDDAKEAVAGTVGREPQIDDYKAPPQPQEPPQAPSEPEPPKPQKVEKVSPATPNPPTAALPTTPESPETIALQIQQLGKFGDPAQPSQRKAVMFPGGQGMPDLATLAGLKITHDEFNNVYAYRPDLITPGEIHRAAKNNELPTVLGGPLGMGAPDKSALNGTPIAVVAHAPDGTEVQSTVTDAEHLPQTVASTHPVTPLGGTVTVMPPEEALGGRTGVAASQPQKEVVQPAGAGAQLAEQSAPLPPGVPPPPAGFELSHPPPNLTNIYNGGENGNAANIEASQPGRVPEHPEPAAPGTVPEGNGPLSVRGPVGVGGAAAGLPGAEPVAGSESASVRGAGESVPGETATGQPEKGTRRITGTVDAPLIPAGQKQADGMRQNKITVLPDRIITADKERHMETAARLGAAEGVPTVTMPSFDGWPRGIHEGQPADAARPEMSRLIANPDEVPPGVSPISGQPGESWNQAMQPMFADVVKILKSMKPGERVLIVTSGGNLQAIDAWGKSGYPADFSLTPEIRAQIASQPYWSVTGKLFQLGANGLDEVPNDKEPGLFLTEHAQTAYNAKGEKGAAAEGKPEPSIPEQFAGAVSDLKDKTNEEIDQIADILGIGKNPATEAFPPTTENASPDESPHVKLANAILRKLQNEEPIGNNAALQQLANIAFGGSRATTGAYTLKEAHEAVEAAVNRYIADSIGQDLLASDFAYSMGRLRELLTGLPTQNVRTDEQLALQQFSTPPTLAFMASKIAGIQQRDIVLEPSAGTGGLAAWAKAAGAIIHTNEIDPLRWQLLGWALRTKPTTADAEILNATLPKEIQPTVVIMNPPFSATGGRVAKNSNDFGYRHVINALARLQPGGRLVAILGEGARLDAPTARQFWADIAKRGLLRANVGINGKEYAKYGTTFGNRLIVIDKGKPEDWIPQLGRPAALTAISGDFDTIEASYDALEPLIGQRLIPGAGIQPVAESGGQLPAGGGTASTATAGTGGAIRTPEPRPIGGPISAGEPGAGAIPAPAGEPGTETGIAPAAAPAEVGGGLAPRDLGPEPGAVEPARPEDRVALESRQKEDLLERVEDDGAFVQYVPAIRGLAHPGVVVETKVMASVSGPEITYRPNLPVEIARSPKPLSAVQMEAIARAGQSHEQFLESGERTGYLCGDGTGVGKGQSQPLDSKLVTPNGMKFMGDIRVGDLVMSPDGTPTTVLNIFPQGKIPIYRVTFSDGSSTECSEDHLWVTQTREQRWYGKKKKGNAFHFPKIRTTSELATTVRHVHTIPMTEAVQFTSQKVEVDPYLLGVLIADGCLRTHIQITSADDEILEFVRAALPGDLRLREVRKYHYNVRGGPDGRRNPRGSNKLVAALKNYGLVGKTAIDKFVPEKYKINSTDVRLALIQGLMDSDGYIQPDGCMMYYTISKQLALDFAFIVESLGGVARHSVKKTTHNPCFVVTIALPEGMTPFRLSRKLQRMRPRTKYPVQRIVRSIEYSRDAQAQCILVDHPSSLYLTDHFIVTHNTIAGIIWDNNRSGRKRAIWLSGSADLIKQAKGDFVGVGANDLSNQLRSVNDWTPHQAIDHPEGVLFSTYTTLAMGAPTTAGKTRRQQIMEWLGPDGVIIFDEAQRAKNAVPGEQVTEGSKAGKAVVELQRDLPQARVVYVSATAATEVRNLGYMTRLGLWGRGTPFHAGFQQFMSEVGKGGIAAMELIARELKAAGRYLSRSISYKGVTFNERIHPLSSEQEAIYDSAAQAWQNVLQRALDQVGENGGSDRQKRAIRNSIWGEHQRFFRALLTAMKTPTLFEMIDAGLNDPSEPRAIIVSLIGTGEAQGKRQLAQVTEENDDLDFSPREILINVIRRVYPIHLMEEYTDPETGETGTRYVKGPDGELVVNPEAVAARDALIAELTQNLALPESPLDQIISTYGRENVAEITGRKKTVRRNPDTGKWEMASRAPEGVRMDDINQYEMDQFQDGKKNILVMSKAGGTGFSFHADLSRANQRKRQQIALELSWAADDQMQAFGRGHRSNQRVPPEFDIVSTNAGGEKRFSSSIARRLESLGALSRGQRDASGGSSVLAKYNFETEQGLQAANSFYNYLLQDPEIPGSEWNGLDILRKMGVLDENVDEHTGEPKGPPSVAKATRENVTRLLNRILNVEIRAQNAVYNLFTNFFDEAVQSAIEAGRLDTGVNLVRGDHIRLLESRQIAVDAETNAPTYRYIVDVERKNKPVPVETVRALHERQHGKMMRRRETRGMDQPDQLLWVERSNQPITTRSGNVERAYRVFGPGHRENARDYRRLSESDLNSYYEPMEGADNTEQLQRFDADITAYENSIKQAEESAAKGEITYFGGMQDRGSVRRLQYYNDQLKKAKAERKTLWEAMKKLREGQWDEWQKAYDAVPPGRTDRIDMIGGSVMRVWSHLHVGQGRMDIRIAYPDSGGSITGVVMNEGDANAVEFALTGKSQTRTPASIFRAAVARQEKFSLTGGIRVQQGRVGRDPVLEIVTTDPYAQQFLTRNGVRKEIVNYRAKYYIPNSPDIGVPILEKVLKQYPLMSEGQVFARPRVTPGGPVWYSQLERAVEQKMPSKASPAQVAAIIGNPQNGVKPDEVKWTGLRDWLQEQKGPVTRDEVLGYLRQNAVQVQEVLRGGPKIGTDVGVLQDLTHRKLVLDGEIQSVTDAGGDASEQIKESRKIAAEIDKERKRLDAEAVLAQPKYKQYTIPGGRDYGELLLTLPSQRERATWTPDEYAEVQKLAAKIRGDHGQVATEAERARWQELRDRQIAANNLDYKSPHWDQPNVVGHIRFATRVTPDGQKVFHLEELQSDLHQAGRSKGYQPTGEARAELERQFKEADEAHNRTADARNKALEQFKWHTDPNNDEARRAGLAAISEAENANNAAWARRAEIDKNLHGGVPAAPFAKTWPEMLFRRAVRYAAENGFDRISWTTGTQQASRYDLSKYVSKVEYLPASQRLMAYDNKTGDRVIDKIVPPEEVADYIGKDTAKKLLESVPKKIVTVDNGREVPTEWHELSGLDLQVGGQGMNEFYDQMLPRYAEKFGKKWGAKVEGAKIVTKGLPAYKYTGPSFSVASWEKFIRDRRAKWHDGTTEGNSSWNVTLDREATSILTKMDAGLTFEGAISAQSREMGYESPIAREVGGSVSGKSSKETETVHSMEITPSMAESVLAGQPLFRPRTDLTDDGGHPDASKVDAVYEKLLEGHGHIYANRSAVDLIAQVLDRGKVWGMTIGPQSSGILLNHLREIAADPAFKGIPVRKIVTALTQAIRDNPVVTIVEAGPSTPASEIQKTRREEAFHRHQFAVGAISSTAGDEFVARNLMRNPEIRKAYGLIQKRGAYNERTAMIELGAMLGTGQHTELGLSDQDAAKLFRAYLDTLMSTIGPQAGTLLKFASPQVRKALGADYVRARWNGKYAEPAAISGNRASAPIQPAGGTGLINAARAGAGVSGRPEGQNAVLEEPIAHRPRVVLKDDSRVSNAHEAVVAADARYERPSRIDPSHGHIYLNEAAADLTPQLMRMAHLDAHDFDGVTLDKWQTERFAAFLSTIAQRNPAAAAILGAIRAAQIDSPVTTFIRYGTQTSIPEVQATRREEAFHRAQKNTSNTVPYTLPARIGDLLLQDPFVAEAMRRVRENRYTASPEQEWEEFGAVFASGQGGSIGYNIQESATLLRKYVDSLIEANGPKAGAVLKMVIPQMRKALGENYVRSRWNGRYRSPQDRLPAGNGPGNGGGEPNFRPKQPNNSRTGSGDIYSARPLSQANVTLGSGLGGLQPGLEAAARDVGRFAKEDIVPAVKNVGAWGQTARQAIQQWFAPQTIDAGAKLTAGRLRAMLGKNLQARDRAEAGFKKYEEEFYKRPAELGVHALDVIDAIEDKTGELVKNLDPIGQSFARAIRTEYDGRWNELNAVGRLDSYVENYYTHLYKDPKKAETFVGNWQTRRPLAGNERFRKQRIYPTFREAITPVEEGGGGLEPLYDNPVSYLLAGLANMDKSIHAWEFFNEQKGRLKFSRKGPPEGYQQVDDRIFTVYGPRKGGVSIDPLKMEPVPQRTDFGLGPGRWDFPSASDDPNSWRAFQEALQDWRDTNVLPEDVTVHGQRIMGHYYALAGDATVINNYLRPGFEGNARKVVDGYMKLKGGWNALNLSFSYFHGVTTLYNQALSDVALGMKQLTAGQPLKAVETVVTSPYKIMRDLLLANPQGKRLVAAWDGTLADATLEEMTTVEWLKQAGGSPRQSAYNERYFRDGLRRAIAQGTKTGVALRLVNPLLLAEVQMAPIMTKMVPRAKMAAFMNAVRFETERNPYMTLDQIRHKGAEIWDSMDDRFGQLSQTNMLMSNMVKDVMNIVVGRPGWTIGTLRTVVGGAYDFGKAVNDAAHGRPPEFTHKMAGTLGIIIIGTLTSGILSWLLTGEAPTGMDYVDPRTGGFNDDGTPSRIVMPGYWSKDIHSWATDPIATAKAKLAQPIGLLADLLSNRDYSRHKIWGENGIGFPQFLRNEVLAYSVQGLMRNYERGGKFWGPEAYKTYLPSLGIQPASASVGRSKAMDMIAQYQQEHSSVVRDASSPHSRARARIYTATKNGLKTGDMKEALKLGEDAVMNGTMSSHDVAAEMMRARQNPITVEYKGVNDLRTAMRIYSAATEDEKKMIKREANDKARRAANKPWLWQKPNGEPDKEVLDIAKKNFNVTPVRPHQFFEGKMPSPSPLATPAPF